MDYYNKFTSTGFERLNTPVLMFNNINLYKTKAFDIIHEFKRNNNIKRKCKFFYIKNKLDYPSEFIQCMEIMGDNISGIYVNGKYRSFINETKHSFKEDIIFTIIHEYFHFIDDVCGDISCYNSEWEYIIEHDHNNGLFVTDYEKQHYDKRFKDYSGLLQESFAISMTELVLNNFRFKRTFQKRYEFLTKHFVFKTVFFESR
jgi:hypothetical protein